jgi:hypothetical protein
LTVEKKLIPTNKTIMAKAQVFPCTSLFIVVSLPI